MAICRRIPLLLHTCIRCYRTKAKEYSGVKVFKSLNLETDNEMNDMNPFGPVTETSREYLDQLNPPLKKSFNLAAYVNQSGTLQELLKLGVSFYDIENTNMAAAKYIMNLNFKEDCLPYVKFLLDNGLKEKNVGRFISEYPFIFQEPLEDLQTRINYLESKGFTSGMIAKALNNSSHILYHKTKTLDYKLGELQIEFNLPAKSLRLMVVQQPRIISIPRAQYILVNFSLKEEFGFTQMEIQRLLEIQPLVLEIPRFELIERFDLVHNTLGISHKLISEYPKLITGPVEEIRNRGLYLKRLSRDQYNPREPLYVPPTALYSIDDGKFCEQYAKTSLKDYLHFIKYS